ncbi:MAG: hypothetical protein KDD52_01725 [Bdellovibrionales bacterium]|nr:hypothetical protein [Bdellovibrionales bacterium]
MNTKSIQELEDLIISYVYEMSWGQKWDGKPIPADVFKSYLSQVEKLSNLFTVDREQMGIRYFRKKENRIAYLLYFHLSNMVRASAIIEEMKKRKAWPKKIERVMDLGTGSGASLWALAQGISSPKQLPSLMYALDEDRSILNDGKKLWHQYCKMREITSPNLVSQKVDVLSLKGLEALEIQEKLDLIFCSNLVNEFSLISDSGKISLFKYLVDQLLSDDGALMIMEPASLDISRDLLHLREMLLDCLDIHISLPCSGTQSCPMISDAKDWCHFEIPWDIPRVKKRLEKELNRNSEVLKYSYIVIQKGQKKSKRRSKYRSLSPMLKNRDGGYFVLLCSDYDKLSLRSKKGDKESKQKLKNIQRGDVISLQNCHEDKLDDPKLGKQVWVGQDSKIVIHP